MYIKYTFYNIFTQNNLILVGFLKNIHKYTI